MKRGAELTVRTGPRAAPPFCRLYNNDIGDPGAIRLAEALEKNTSVTKIGCVVMSPRH